MATLLRGAGGRHEWRRYESVPRVDCVRNIHTGERHAWISIPDIEILIAGHPVAVWIEVRLQLGEGLVELVGFIPGDE